MTKRAVITFTVGVALSFSSWIAMQLIDLRGEVAVLKSNIALLMQAHHIDNNNSAITNGHTENEIHHNS